MEWSWIPSTAAAAVNAIAVYVWKPWAQAYSTEKAKNFARQEDIEKILIEVRAVTATQKEIEAKISQDVWHRQWLINQKRDFYIDAFSAIHIAQTHAAAAAMRSDPSVTEEVLGGFSKFSREMGRIQGIAMLFGNYECIDAIGKFLQAIMNLPIHTKEGAWRYGVALSELQLSLASAAHKDLGIPRPADSRVPATSAEVP